MTTMGTNTVQEMNKDNARTILNTLPTRTEEDIFILVFCADIFLLLCQISCSSKSEFSFTGADTTGSLFTETALDLEQFGHWHRN